MTNSAYKTNAFGGTTEQGLVAKERIGTSMLRTWLVPWQVSLPLDSLGVPIAAEVLARIPAEHSRLQARFEAGFRDPEAGEV